jgi:hypothetical protein
MYNAETKVDIRHVFWKARGVASALVASETTRSYSFATTRHIKLAALPALESRSPTMPRTREEVVGKGLRQGTQGPQVLQPLPRHRPQLCSSSPRRVSPKRTLVIGLSRACAVKPSKSVKRISLFQLSNCYEHLCFGLLPPASIQKIH